MDAAYISALAALAGSAIGAFSSFATTWLTQNATRRVERVERDRARREALYGAFIDEGSTLLANAIVNELGSASEFVKLYSMISRIRLFASEPVVSEAESFAETLIVAYREPSRTFSELQRNRFQDSDPLRRFSEACRAELNAL